jgi:hypothetical protein
MKEPQRGSLGVVGGAAAHRDFMKIAPLPRELRIRHQALPKLGPLARDLEAAR